MIVFMLLIPLFFSCPFPSLYEYLSPFDIPTNDVYLLTQNQFSSDEFSSYAVGHITISNIFYTTKSNSSSRSITPSPPSYHYYVANESIFFLIKLNASIKNTIKTKNYTASFNVSLAVQYQKTILKDGRIGFDKISVAVSDVGKIQYKQQPTSEDQGNLNNAIIGKNTSVLTLIEKATLNSTLLGYFIDNLSPIVYNNTYNDKQYYTYQSIFNKNIRNNAFASNNLIKKETTITINLTLKSLLPYTSGMSYGMLGTISPADLCSTTPPQQSYLLFFSIEFISNIMTQFNKQMVLNKQTVHPFQFRVIDLQFIVSNALNDVPFDHQIQFICNNERKTIQNIKEQIIILTAEWSCIGYADKSILMNFTTQTSHQIAFSIEQNATCAQSMIKNQQLNQCSETTNNRFLKTNIILVELVQTVYYNVGSHEVIDKELANKYISASLHSFQGATIGTGFKLNKQAKQCILKSQGLYIR